MRVLASLSCLGGMCNYPELPKDQDTLHVLSKGFTVDWDKQMYQLPEHSQELQQFFQAVKAAYSAVSKGEVANTAAYLSGQEGSHAQSSSLAGRMLVHEGVHECLMLITQESQVSIFSHCQVITQCWIGGNRVYITTTSGTTTAWQFVWY